MTLDNRMSTRSPGRLSAGAPGEQLQGVRERRRDRRSASPMLRGLPGKLTIRVRPRMPATPRESIQCRRVRARGGAHRLGDPRRLALDHRAASPPG